MVHKCALKQFKYSAAESKQKAETTGDLSADEDKWYCNGGAHFGFEGGCKGEQKDFDYHE